MLTGFVCALQDSVPPVLWKFCNQIPLAFKIKFPGGFKFLCWISRLGNLLLTLELLQQCENFFGIIVLQFVGCLLSGSIVGLTCCTSQVCCNQSPCPHSRPLLTHASAGDTQTLKGRYVSVSVGNLGAHKVLFEPSEHLWQEWDLILNVILPLLPFCCGFSSAFGHGVFFLVGSKSLSELRELEMDREGWRAVIHGVTKSRT